MEKLRYLPVLFGVTLLMFTSMSRAETNHSIAISVDPFRAEVVVEPGETSALEVMLMNDNKSDVTVTVEFKEFEVDEYGSPVIKDPESQDSPSYWLSFEEMVFDMVPAEEKVMNLLIDVPSDTPPRGNYVAVVYLFKPHSEDDQEVGSVTTITRVQSLIAIITGEVEERGNVTTEVLRDADGKVLVKTVITNTGDIHFDPKGKITVKNMFGGTMVEFSMEDDGAKVLPGGTRVYENEADLSWAFGNYTVNTELTAGAHGLVMTDSVSFSAYSSSIWIVLGIVVVVGVAVVVLMRRDKNTKKVSQI